MLLRSLRLTLRLRLAFRLRLKLTLRLRPVKEAEASIRRLRLVAKLRKSIIKEEG